MKTLIKVIGWFILLASIGSIGNQIVNLQDKVDMEQQYYSNLWDKIGRLEQEVNKSEEVGIQKEKSSDLNLVIGKKYQATVRDYDHTDTFTVTYKGVDNVNKYHCGDGRGDKFATLGDCWFNVSMDTYEVCVPLQKPSEMSEAEFAKYKALSDKLWTEAVTINEL